MTAPSVPALPDARQSLGPAQLDDLFPEGETYRRSIRTYVVLLTCAAFIATFGLYADSVAAIIGAMVVAPLGGAIMAVGGSLATGRIEWQGRTIVQVALSAVWVIAIGFAVSLVIPNPLEPNPSIDARTHPGLLDLGVAVAAGVAGAWVTVRRTGTDALPGVAIAVSLVPPLAVVGISMELGRLDDAAGALELFLTNVISIVLAAVIVFVIARATPDRTSVREHARLRRGLILAVIGLAVVTIPLAWRATDTVIETVRVTTAAPVVSDWIGDRDLTVSDYVVDGSNVTIELVGPDAPPDPQPLAAALSDAWGIPVSLEVGWIARQDSSATSP